MKTTILLTIILVTLLSIGFLAAPAYSQTLTIQQGSVFEYQLGRFSTSDQSNYQGNVTYRVLSFNQQELQVEIAGSNYSFLYQDGFPVYADHLEALFYLPPQAIQQSINGNLEWVQNFNSTNMGTANPTVQELNYTTQATQTGTFRCINLTLTVTGMDYGALSFLFDVNSGILIYEQYVPSYGDIIIQELSDIQSSQPSQSVLLLSAVVSAAILCLPIAIAVIQVRRKIRKSHLLSQSENATNESALNGRRSIKQPLIILTGATLSLVAVLLPWGQTGNSQAFLLTSLPSLFSSSQVLPPSPDTFFAVSFLAHAATIIAWACLALYLFSSKPKVTALAAVTSAALTFTAAFIFIQVYSAASYGVMVLIVGAGILLVGLLAGKKPPTKTDASGISTPSATL